MSEHSKPYKIIQKALKMLLLPIRLPWRLIRRLFQLFASDKDMTKAFWDSFKNSFVVGLLIVVFLQSFKIEHGLGLQIVTGIAVSIALIAHFAQLHGQFSKPFLTGGFQIVFREEIFSTKGSTDRFGRYPGDSFPRKIRLHDDAYVPWRASTYFMFLMLQSFPFVVQGATILAIGISAVDYMKKFGS
jgi:hypothetical protein